MGIMTFHDPYAASAAVLDVSQLINGIYKNFDYSDKALLIKVYSQLYEGIRIDASNAHEGGYWIRFYSKTYSQFNSPWIIDIVMNNGVVLEDMKRFDLISVFSINGVKYAKFSDGLIVKLSLKWEERFFDYYKNRYGK